ncbi:MAG: hypothetical protein JW715_06815 [Sedimentisphaerales bacterium]|nr:hypothetical protein [Sedimentisphaerales bacterium]
MKKYYIFVAFFVSTCVILTGCSSFPLFGTPHGSIQIKAFIDGSDTIKIRGNELWYEHQKYDLPGKWQGRFDEATTINGVEWKPEWNGLMSNRFGDFKPAMPKKNLDEITLTRLQGRGDVDITAKPGKENDYTLSIFIDDNQYNGAEWYEIKVEW